jgi:DNA replication protein DnaC
MMKAPTNQASIDMILNGFRLPSWKREWRGVMQTAEKQGWTFERFLGYLCELEVIERNQRKGLRLLKESKLPVTKTIGTLDVEKLSLALRRQLPSLCEGGFVERGENVLVFGLPGRGKTHLVAAIGHELVHRGYRVLFTPTFRLVQRLLAAKRDLSLERELRRLDVIDVVILDDIGYVQQSREEMEVLFTFLAERYERKSVMITSNLVFSEWDKIFKDPMTTAAAVDRVVHHAIILELNGMSFRIEEAKRLAERRGQDDKANIAQQLCNTKSAP